MLASTPWRPFDGEAATNSFTIRLSNSGLSLAAMTKMLHAFDSLQKCSYKINVALSLLLRSNTEHPDVANLPHENSTRFFYPSSNTTLFPHAQLIHSPSSLNKFISNLLDINLNEYGANKTIESKWLLDHLGSLTFYITYMPHIVYETDRPDPLLDNTHTHNEQGTIGHNHIPLPDRISSSNAVLNIKNTINGGLRMC